MEFAILKGGCKFNNCLHTNHSGNAVKKAIEQGEISAIDINRIYNTGGSIPIKMRLLIQGFQLQP